MRFLKWMPVRWSKLVDFALIKFSVAPAESSSASGTYNVFRDMTAPFGVAIFVPMFVTGMTKKAATGMAVPAAAASALHSVALVQLICVVVGIVVCFLIPSVHKKAEAAKE